MSSFLPFSTHFLFFLSLLLHIQIFPSLLESSTGLITWKKASFLTNKGRYVFSWGGGLGNFGIFFQKKVLALPHVLIKKLLTPPLLGDWQKCDPPLTTTWYAPCHRNLRTFFDILLVNAKCLNMNKSRYWICAA